MKKHGFFYAVGAVALAMCARPAVAQPVNDLCTAPTVISTEPFTDQVDTTTATSSADDPKQSCSTKSASRNSNSVWYSWTASTNGIFQFDTAGSNYDTVVTAYTGTCGALTEVACNDDPNGFAAAQPGKIVMNVTAGTTYLIEVTQFGAPGGGLLEVSSSTVPAATNDDCTAALTIGALPFSNSSDTTGTTSPTSDPIMGCGSGRNSHTVWYSITPGPGTVTVSTLNSNYDTVLSVYTGSCGSLHEVTCDDDYVFNGNATLQSLVSFISQAGQSYLIEVAAYGVNSGGILSLNVTPAHVCGDGVVDPGEQCDDGNTNSCDGCSSTCQIETGSICGDGIINWGCEQCDDGNTTSGDGCSSKCTFETPVTRCQTAVANAGRKFAGKVQQAVQKCRSQINQRRLFISPSDCMSELTTSQAILTAGENARTSVASACTDTQLNVLQACAPTLDEVVSSDGTQGCLIESHRDAVIRMIQAEYGPQPTPTPPPTPTATP